MNSKMDYATPLELLANIGYRYLTRSNEAALEFLLSPVIARPDYHGVQWGGKNITWPDRVPDLKTWSGQMKLSTLIKKYQAALQGYDPSTSLLEFQVPLVGASGMDPAAAQDAIDVGFSLNKAGMPVMQYPGRELLAIVGLETVPIVSLGRRKVGVIYGGKIWRWKIFKRAGGYLSKWGTHHQTFHGGALR